MLVIQFFVVFISVRAAPYFSHFELQRWRPKLCETRERFSIIEIPKHKCRFVWFNTRPLIGRKVSCHFLSQSEHQPKINVRLLRAFHSLGSVFATLDNTIIIFLSPRPPPKNLHNHCFQFLLGLRIVSRETENNGYAKLWGGGGGWRDKKIIMVFSKVANPRCSLEIRLVHSLVCVS